MGHDVVLMSGGMIGALSQQCWHDKKPRSWGTACCSSSSPQVSNMKDKVPRHQFVIVRNYYSLPLAAPCPVNVKNHLMPHISIHPVLRIPA